MFLASSIAVAMSSFQIPITTGISVHEPIDPDLNPRPRNSVLEPVYPTQINQCHPDTHENECSLQDTDVKPCRGNTPYRNAVGNGNELVIPDANSVGSTRMLTST